MNDNLKNYDIVPDMKIQEIENLDDKMKMNTSENKTAEKRRRFSEVGSFHKSFIDTSSDLKEQNTNQQRSKRKKEVSFRLWSLYL